MPAAPNDTELAFVGGLWDCGRAMWRSNRNHSNPVSIPRHCPAYQTSHNRWVYSFQHEPGRLILNVHSYHRRVRSYCRWGNFYRPDRPARRIPTWLRAAIFHRSISHTSMHPANERQSPSSRSLLNTDRSARFMHPESESIPAAIRKSLLLSTETMLVFRSLSS